MPHDLNDGDQVKLLQIAKIHHDDLTPEFIEYDTTILDGGNYELPNKFLLLLIFISEKDEGIFTTLRKLSPEKEKFYRDAQGELFEVIINAHTGSEKPQ